jgi:hypothetical protein
VTPGSARSSVQKGWLKNTHIDSAGADEYVGLRSVHLALPRTSSLMGASSIPPQAPGLSPMDSLARSAYNAAPEPFSGFNARSVADCCVDLHGSARLRWRLGQLPTWPLPR